MDGNGQVTIREVYAISERILSEVKKVDDKLGEFKSQCNDKSGGLDKRVTLLEDKADKFQYVGRENRGFIFNGLMMLLCAAVGAGSVLLVEFVR